MKTINRFLLLILLGLVYMQASGQPHPHILVNDGDKQLVLNKIQQQAWAGKIFGEMDKGVATYVERHKTDPQWILSRYQMNRVPGKRFTRGYADNNGARIIRWEGDAPVPTVKISSYLRSPVTPSGGSYSRPSIEELVPNDTSQLMNLLNIETNQKEWINPQQIIPAINGEINDLALDAAIIYWLKGDERYAKFAADIINQWGRGAFYQEPLIGPCRIGFLDIQTLGDATYRNLVLAYDFVYPFMKQNGYDLNYYETVFEKMASTLAFRGFWNNNWYAAESSTMVFASLSLENQKKKDYYLQFYLYKDTINGACGQLGLPSTVEKWLTPDGHWKEPGGYHNYPVSNLLISAIAMEKNGYDIFRKFPALFKASYAMLKYSFPNLTVSAFGDTGRASQSPESLEIGLIGAIKYKEPELPEMLASMKKLIEGGRYKRENSGFLGLLCFIPELPSVDLVYSWPRSGTLEFARYFLQRNGSDPQYGLMYGVQGASYNHNHNNGMAMELYGMGDVMGIDAGSGPTYEHPLHQGYFSQWASHNTVVAAGTSSSVPFSGSAGRKEIGQIDLAAMEPMPDKEAVSPECSFTDTRYFDKSTNTNEMRTMALVRTSEKSGYYVDIYRSDNTISNDYVYHNIGDQVTFLNDKREPVNTVPAEYPLTGKDYPGFRYFTGVKKLSDWSQNLIALFSIKDSESKDIFMQLLIPGKTGRDYYQARSLKTKTSGRVYSGKTLPLITMRDNGESKSKPFVVVFEPYRGMNGYCVEKISAEERRDGEEFTALNIYNKDHSSQIVLQSVNKDKPFTSGKGTLKGYLGIIGLAEENISFIYLGKGSSISYGGYLLSVKNGEGSANIKIGGDKYLITCNQETEFEFPVKKVEKLILSEGSGNRDIKFSEKGNSITFILPAIKNGEVRISFKTSDPTIALRPKGSGMIVIK
jgi:hypothetical protein